MVKFQVIRSGDDGLCAVSESDTYGAALSIATDLNADYANGTDVFFVIRAAR